MRSLFLYYKTFCLKLEQSTNKKYNSWANKIMKKISSRDLHTKICTLEKLRRRDVDTYAFESSSKLNSMGTRLFICAIWSLLQTRSLCIIHRTIIFATDDDGDHAPFLGARTSVAALHVLRTKNHTHTLTRGKSDDDRRFTQVGKNFSHNCNDHTPIHACEEQ